MAALGKVTANALANFAGSFWGGLIALIVIPIYIRYLGVESFGLIGIATTISMIASLSDFGLAAVLMREMARDWKDEASIREGRAVLSTLTRLYLPLAALLGALVMTSAPYIASHWLNAIALPDDTVEHALRWIGFMVIFQLIAAFYFGGLSGLQHQVHANAIGGVIALLHAMGGVGVLAFYDAHITTLFAWQSFCTVLQAGAYAYMLHRLMPVSQTASADDPQYYSQYYLQFDRALLRKISSFGWGMSGIGLVNIVLTQADKVIMSRLLSLHDFGLYSLAMAVAMSLRRLFGPLYAAMYPRFTELVRRGDAAALERLYHVASQAMSVVVLPASLLLMIYSYEAVYVWTGDIGIAYRIDTLITLMVAGAALTGLAQMPYAMQLAHGWTSLALRSNLLAAAWFVPGTWLLGMLYGGEGAAMAWVMSGLICLLVQAPLMHRRILHSCLGRWWRRDILLPAIASAIPLIVALPVFRVFENDRLLLIGVFVAAYMLSVIAAMLTVKELMKQFDEWLRY